MTNEEADNNERTLLSQVIREAMQPQGHVIHWYDIVALMIIGYWLGNAINGFWWVP